MKNILRLLILLVFVTAFWSCEEEDDIPEFPLLMEFHPLYMSEVPITQNQNADILWSGAIHPTYSHGEVTSLVGYRHARGPYGGFDAEDIDMIEINMRRYRNTTTVNTYGDLPYISTKETGNSKLTYRYDKLIERINENDISTQLDNDTTVFEYAGSKVISATVYNAYEVIENTFVWDIYDNLERVDFTIYPHDIRIAPSSGYHLFSDYDNAENLFYQMDCVENLFFRSLSRNNYREYTFVWHDNYGSSQQTTRYFPIYYDEMGLPHYNYLPEEY
ncbi:hypothetical protein EYV94_12285 [Puteibacter caeruleilacunae]|nr:hypothetical protein EYV94_12285 [Puteibacter caeruleilacunae]